MDSQELQEIFNEGRKEFDSLKVEFAEIDLDNFDNEYVFFI